MYFGGIVIFGFLIFFFPCLILISLSFTFLTCVDLRMGLI